MAETTPLLIVPTGGLVRDESGALSPTTAGILRLNKAAEFLRDHPGALLAISGGMRDDFSRSEAKIYQLLFRRDHPGLAGRIALVDASSKYTAGDMTALAIKLEFYEATQRISFNPIIVVTHRDHARLAVISLSDSIQNGLRDFEMLESGEPAPYSDRNLKILRWVTTRDPKWTKLWSWPLRLIANRRGRNE